MALFSFGSDKYGKKKIPSNPVSGKPGTFDGPVQFRAPGTPFKASDLEITPNPYGPKRQEPASKYAKVGGVTIGLKGSPTTATASKPSAPSGFNYSQVPAPKSPATVNTAAVAQAPSPAPGGGFSASPGSSLASRVAAMGKAAGGQPVQAANVPSSPASIGAASVQPQIPNDVIRRTAEQNLEKYRQGVLSAMSPSEQERALADELAQFQGQARLGISGLEGQGRGIPLGLVRGQQAQLQEQAGIQEQTLLGRLNAAQQARQAELEASRAALGFEEADIAREEARANAQAAGIKPIEIGGSLVALNPSTGQYEVVYQAPGEADAAKGFTLGEGQAYYDAQGNLVAERGKTFAPSRAGGGVGGGSFGAGMAGLSPLAKSIADNPGLMANLTPTEKGKVLRELAGAGVGMEAFGLADLNAGQREKISLFDTLMGTAQGVGDIVAGGVNTGPLAGRFQAGARALLGTGQKFGELQSLVANMNTTLLNLRSGAAVTPQEFERLSAFIPSPNDQESVIKQKISSFNSELQRAKEDFISRATQPVSVIAGVGGGGTATSDFRAKYDY